MAHGGPAGRAEGPGPWASPPCFDEVLLLKKWSEQREEGRALLESLEDENSSFMPRGGPSSPHGSYTTMSSRVPTMCACAQTWGVQDTPGLEEGEEGRKDQSYQTHSKGRSDPN